MTGETPKVVPVVGILGRMPLTALLESQLETLLGPARLHSPTWDFTATRYYEKELGTNLQRAFLAYDCQPCARLPVWKRETCRLEESWKHEGKRQVNLDPGYVSFGGLFLASTKAGLHRICLADGIYAEITLHYAHHNWVPLPWTFPDFRSGLYDAFLSRCRDLLKPLIPGPHIAPE